MKVTKVIIDKFRALVDIQIPIAEKITAIAGQNCTAKSSMLGLIGHVFTFDKRHRTIDGRQFVTKYSEIFKFSYPAYDKPKEHRYSLEFDNGVSIRVLSYDRIEAGKENELRLRVGKSEKDGGKLTHPVFYLGLKRLFPLAQENRVYLYKRSVLTTEEVEEYNRLHNEILLLDEQIIPERVETRTKKFYGAKTKYYDSLGNSAGQDNLGQLLTAIFSFRRLKQQLGNDYHGGILLVDEIDATLYPAAQMKLIEKLHRISSDLDLQIIFTTHSLDTLSFLNQEKYRYHSKIVYLNKATGEVQVESDMSFQKIVNDLKVLPPRFPYLEKIHVYCEDREAKCLLMKLLKQDVRKKIKVIPASLSAGMLLELVNRRIPDFQCSIIVLDGDQAKRLKKPKPRNVLILPGNDSPEKVFHAYLSQLQRNDKFWGGFGSYTKQVCFKDCLAAGSRDIMKEWFNCQLPYWGRGAYKLINRWMEDNPKVVEDFRERFTTILNKLSNM